MELIFNIDYSSFLRNMNFITDISLFIKIKMQENQGGRQLYKL